MASVSQVCKAPGAVAVGGGGVFFEHGVGVDSGEAEGIDAGSPRRRWVGVDPGA